MNSNPSNLINHLLMKPKPSFYVNNETSTNEDYSEKKTNKEETSMKEQKVMFLKRKKKAETKGRDFKCTICSISYLSYPALYTHHRNKHSLIPITNKRHYFKSSLTNNSKFKYSKLDQNTNISSISDMLILYYYDIFKHFLLNPNSYFYSPLADFEYDEFTCLLQNLKLKGKVSDSEEELKQSSIGKVLVIYLALMMKITKDDRIIKLLILFIFLVKEYLEIFGWEYYLTILEVGIKLNLGVKRGMASYWNTFTCEDFPDLMNDFVSIFLLIEPEIAEQQSELTDICHNFSLWLVSRNLTSFHLIRIND